MNRLVFPFVLLTLFSVAWVYMAQQQQKLAISRSNDKKQCQEMAKNYEPIWQEQRALDNEVERLANEREISISVQKQALEAPRQNLLQAKGKMDRRRKEIDIGGYVMGGNSQRGREASERHGRFQESIESLDNASDSWKIASNNFEKLQIESYKEVEEARSKAAEHRNTWTRPAWERLEQSCVYVDDMKQMEERFSAQK